MRVHVTNDGSPIPSSAICARCEGDAGLRIKSYIKAQQNKDFNGDHREERKDLPCAFCGRSK